MITDLPLYQNYKDFQNKVKVGSLKQLKQALLTEKANDAFTVDITAIAQTKAIGQLKPRMIVGVVTDKARGEQAFVIKRWQIQLNGQVTIYAEHMIMSLCEVGITAGRLKNLRAEYAIQQWQKLLAKTNDEVSAKFWGTSDVVADTELETEVRPDLFANAFQVLMGARGSILDTWGGEYRFNNTKIELLKSRGKKSTIPIRQGDNLLDFTYEQTSIDNYDSVNGYAKVEKDGVTYAYFGSSGPHKVVRTVRDIDQVLTIDFTDRIPEKLLNDTAKNPTVSTNIRVKLDELNASYAKSNKERFQAEEKESVKVTPIYEPRRDKNLLEEWALFNTVTIDLPMVGYKAEAKIVETQIDLLQGKLVSLSLGKPKRTVI